MTLTPVALAQCKTANRVMADWGTQNHTTQAEWKVIHMDTSRWTVRCAACGLVRPWSEREGHRDKCPMPPVKLEDALGVLMAASAVHG